MEVMYQTRHFWTLGPELQLTYFYIISIKRINFSFVWEEVLCN